MILDNHDQTIPPVTPGRGTPPETLSHQIIALLAQHRMATTAQIHTLLRPASVRTTVANPLAKLRAQHLINSAVLPATNRTRVWFLTGEGARVCRDWPELRGRAPYPISSHAAASLRTAHTLTVLRAHLAFATDARRRGDEHGYLDWAPEITHHLGDGEKLIADAVLYYILNAEERRSKLRAFVEVDRATMTSERLATKLIDYARLHTYTPLAPGRRASAQGLAPAWQRWYPVFPRVLFILTGAGPRTLAHRIDDLRAMATEHPLVADLAHQVPVGAAVLDDLEEDGPTGAVWTPLGRSGGLCAWTEL
ncbi:replication-relaxation family protein [Streptomyces monticola]|uniref:Replication-relaxation family protein n=1 Tax=Streptomyces monticola TaxID=2666263 RepID=A0ABW2JU95_9ACTN